MNLKTAPASVIRKRIVSLEKRRKVLDRELSIVQGALRVRSGELVGAMGIILHGVNPDYQDRLMAIKTLRSVVYMGLREAKDFIEAAREGKNPCVGLERPLTQVTS